MKIAALGHDLAGGAGKALKIGGQFGGLPEQIGKARARPEFFAHVLDRPAHLVGVGQSAFTDRIIR